MRFSFIDWKNKEIKNNPPFRTLMSVEEWEYVEERVENRTFALIEYPETGDQEDLNMALKKVNSWVKWKIK